MSVLADAERPARGTNKAFRPHSLCGACLQVQQWTVMTCWVQCVPDLDRDPLQLILIPHVDDLFELHALLLHRGKRQTVTNRRSKFNG